MGVSPIVMNGMVGRTQDFSAIKQNEDNKANLDSANMHHKVEQKIERNVNTVQKQDDTDKSSWKFDAKEKGNGEYTGDGGSHRKQKQEEPSDGKVVIKSQSSFDIKI